MLKNNKNCIQKNKGRGGAQKSSKRTVPEIYNILFSENLRLDYTFFYTTFRPDSKEPIKPLKSCKLCLRRK